MKDYIIISDSSCDIEEEVAKEMGIDIIPFYIQFLSEDFKLEGKEIKIRDLYQGLVDNPGVYPKTSLPTTKDFIDMFKKHLDKGLDIICLDISSKFSGTYQQALTAKGILEEEYKDSRITVIDTKCVTILQGLLVKECVRLKKAGASYDELVDAINSHIDSGRIFFTLSGLKYLEHGGRIGKVSSMVGDFLKINPIITLQNGELFSTGKAISRVRGMAKVKTVLIDYLKDIKATPEEYVIAVGFGYDIEEGKAYYESIKEALPEYDITLGQIGSAICVHTGPTALGIGLLKKLDK